MPTYDSTSVYAVLLEIFKEHPSANTYYPQRVFAKSKVSKDFINAQKDALSRDEVLVFMRKPLGLDDVSDIFITWAYQANSLLEGDCYFMYKLNRNNLYEELKEYILKVQEVNRQPESLLTFDFIREKDMIVSNISKIAAKLNKFNYILEDIRIKEHPVYRGKFDYLTTCAKTPLNTFTISNSEVLFFLNYCSSTNKYEVSHTCSCGNYTDDAYGYFPKVINIWDTEEAVKQIVIYLNDARYLVGSKEVLPNNDAVTSDEEDHFEYGESAYIHYIDDVINSIECQIKDTTDKAQKLLLENAVKSLKAWVILAE